MKRFFFLFFLTNSLFANPEGLTVVSGSASFTNNQSELSVNADDKTILNWEKFSIGKDELTRFNLPSTCSSILNRVSSKEVSKILGKLESNGKVYLLNPNGIIFGKEAYINTASFIASTFDVLDSEFLKNGDICFFGDSKEKIVNLGTIRAYDGDAILIGRFIQNEGLIESEKGITALAVGKEVLLKPLDKERIYIKPSIDVKDEVGIENSGNIKALSAYLKADGNLYSLAIKDSGKIDALSFEEKGGEIFLIAENSTVEASGAYKVTGENGKEVRVLGKNVGVIEGSIDVSGEKNGGQVLIGGDYQGKNKNIYNAQGVFVGKDVFIDASSRKNGNGGKVILWGNESTKFYGDIFAKGGEDKGNGGFVEVSGKYLEFRGKVTTKAKNGQVGQLLLDPGFITIRPTPPSNPTFPQPIASNNYIPSYTGSDVYLFTTDLQNALSVNDVIVSTESNSDWDGIYVLGGSQVTWSTNKLTLTTRPDLGYSNQDISIYSTGTDTFFYAQNGGKIEIFTSLFGLFPNNNSNVYLRTDNGQINVVANTTYGSISVEGADTGSGYANIIATGTGTINLTTYNALSLVADLTAPIAESDAQIRSENGNITINITNAASGQLSIVGAMNETHSGNNISAGIYTTGSGKIIINTPMIEIDGSNVASTKTGIYTLSTGDITVNGTKGCIINAGSLGEAKISSNTNLSFVSTDLTITGGSGAGTDAGLFTGNANAGNINFTVSHLTATANVGKAGIFASTIAPSNIVGFATKIDLTSGSAAASISAPSGSVNLTHAGDVTLTASGAGNVSIESNTNLQIEVATSITMTPTAGNAFISSGIAGGSGTVKINSLAAGSGGIILNSAPANHAAYISSDRGGDITCYFLGASSFKAGGAAGNISGIYSGRLAGSGNIDFRSGDLTIVGGGDPFATAGIFSSASISLNIGHLIATANAGRAGIFASNALGSNITGSLSGISLTSGSAAASISAPGGTINLTSVGAIALTASGLGNASIEAFSNLNMESVTSITMTPTSGDTLISSGILAGSGAVVINNITPGTGGVILNSAGANHASYISSDGGGNITCQFLGASSFKAGGAAGNISGVYSGRIAGGGNINFKSGNLTITGGGNISATAGIFATNPVFGDIIFNVNDLTVVANTGKAGFFTSNINGGIDGSATKIDLTSGSAVAAISAPLADINITNCGVVTLTAGGSGNCSIESDDVMFLDSVTSITMTPTFGDTFISTGISGGNANININLPSPGSGGVILNPLGANHASYISTENGGIITCKFLGNSSFRAGGNAGNISGIYTARLAYLGSGEYIDFRSGNLTITGGGNISATAGLFTGNASDGNIILNVAHLTATANAGAAGVFASNTATSDITGSVTGISLTSGSAVAAISAPAGSINLSGVGNILITGGGAADAYIASLNSLTLSSVNSITMDAISGKTYIQTTGNQNIIINSVNAPGSGGLSFSGNYSSYITTVNGGNIECYFNGSSSFTGGTILGSYSGIITAPAVGGNITFQSAGGLSLNGGTGQNAYATIMANGTGYVSLPIVGSINLIGGSGNSGSSASIETAAGNISIVSSGDILLNGGGAALCQALIQTGAGGGIINISASGKITLQGGTGATTSSIIQTLGGGGNNISILAGEVLLNSSLVDNTSIAAITTANTASLVTVRTNSSVNASGDISIIANLAEAFIKNAVYINAAHDLIINSVLNNAYIATTSSTTPTIIVGNDLSMNGSMSNLSYARITPEGAATDLNLTVTDDAFLSGLVGPAYISGYNTINFYAGDKLTLSSLVNLSYINSVSGNYTLGSLDLGATSANASITATNLNINVFDNNLSLQSSGSGNAFILGTNTSLNVNSSLLLSSSSTGSAYIQSADFSLFNVGFDMTITGSNAYILKTGASSFTIAIGDSLFLNSGYIQNNSGPLTVIAGENMEITQGRIENMTSDDLTLVVDNKYPVAPEIGHGHFEIGPGSTIQTAGGELRLFSAEREFNIIESPLNGVAFIPGPEFDDSNQEIWGLYYPQDFFGGPGFTMFYKNSQDLSHLLLSSVDMAASELFFRLNNMLIDISIIDYLQKFIGLSKYFFIDDKRDMLEERERKLIKLNHSL